MTNIYNIYIQLNPQTWKRNNGKHICLLWLHNFLHCLSNLVYCLLPSLSFHLFLSLRIIPSSLFLLLLGGAAHLLFWQVPTAHYPKALTLITDTIKSFSFYINFTYLLSLHYSLLGTHTHPPPIEEFPSFCLLFHLPR